MRTSAIPTKSGSDSASLSRSSIDATASVNPRGSFALRKSGSIASVTLDTDIQFVKGVGPARAKHFAKLGVRTVGDLIELFPYRYDVRPCSVPIDSLDEGAVATVVGTLQRMQTRGSYRKRTIQAEVVDGTGRCKVRWFNSTYLLDKLCTGQVVRLTGKIEVRGDVAALTNPRTEIVDDDEDALANEVEEHEPVYPATAQLGARQVRRIIDGVLDVALASVHDFVPAALRSRRKLPPRRTAILRCHRPTCPADVPTARARIAYDELLLFQLGVQLSRQQIVERANAKPIVTTEKADERIRRRLPFTLTVGQDRAIAEIRADLARPHPMNRLLQADVGAGKTAVAVYAALSAIANRRQVAFVAPTEILANQHRAKVEQYLKGSRVRMGYLVGSTPGTERKVMLRRLADGQIDFLIGTHALFEKHVRFADLGLVIVDEQHKFGVEQRASLRRKGDAPHVLVLTATPIPRTLAMTVFGDLDVSTIEGRLPGRQRVTTRVVAQDDRARAWAFVRKRIAAGEQAYVVYPLVEASDALPLRAAADEVKRIADTILPGCRVALLHGRMKASEKADVMKRFQAGEVQVLVATTVVEVGVDVAGATMMIVQHAERYGLSQLHQLRGRVGRGTRKSYCLLFSDGHGQAASERLSVLCETDDGFRIAEEDLRLRGPGEMLGTRQHGLPNFRVADIVNDLELLAQARDDAAAMLRSDPPLNRPEHKLLRQEVLKRHGKSFNLINVA